MRRFTTLVLGRDQLSKELVRELRGREIGAWSDDLPRLEGDVSSWEWADAVVINVPLDELDPAVARMLREFDGPRVLAGEPPASNSGVTDMLASVFDIAAPADDAEMLAARVVGLLRGWRVERTSRVETVRTAAA